MSKFKSILAWLAGLISKGKTMNLTTSTVALTVGATGQLTSSEIATYVSGNPAVLTVDANGLVTAVGAGSASVVATSIADATQTSSITFTVTAAALAATVAAAVPDAPAATAPTELEKLEALIEKYGLDTIEKVKAAISFIRAVV